MNENHVSLEKVPSQEEVHSSVVAIGNLAQQWKNPDCSISQISTTVYDVYKYTCGKDQTHQEMATDALYEFTNSIPAEDINHFLSMMTKDNEKMSDQGYRECLLALKTQMLSNAYTYAGDNGTVQVLNFIPVYGNQKFIETGMMDNFESLNEAIEKGLLADLNQNKGISSISIVPMMLNPNVCLDPEKVFLINSHVGQLLENPIQSMAWVEDTIKTCVHDEYWNKDHQPSWQLESSVKDDSISGLIPVFVSFKEDNVQGIKQMMAMALERHGSPNLSFWRSHIMKWLHGVYGENDFNNQTFMFHKPYANSSAAYVVLSDVLVSKFYKAVNLENNVNYSTLYLTIFNRDNNKSLIVASTELLRLYGKQLRPDPFASTISMEVERMDLIDASILYEHIAGNLASNGIQKPIRSQFVDDYMPPVVSEINALADIDTKKDEKYAGRQKARTKSMKMKLH